MPNINNLKKVKSSIINMINVELTRENRLSDVSSILSGQFSMMMN